MPTLTGMDTGFTWCHLCDGEGRVYEETDVDWCDALQRTVDLGHTCPLCKGRSVL